MIGAMYGFCPTHPEGQEEFCGTGKPTEKVCARRASPVVHRATVTKLSKSCESVRLPVDLLVVGFTVLPPPVFGRRRWFFWGLGLGYTFLITKARGLGYRVGLAIVEFPRFPCAFSLTFD
jgi:hypothetical protein